MRLRISGQLALPKHLNLTMSVNRGVLYLFFVSALVIGCQNTGGQSATTESTDNEQEGIKIVADTSVEGTVRSHVSTLWCGEDLSGSYASNATFLYRYENCDEVLETLEIAEVREGLDDSGNTVSAAFLRYSIGTKVFRDVLWFRQVGDRYARTRNRPGTYSDEEDWSAEALRIAEEADTWEENSAEWYE